MHQRLLKREKQGGDWFDTDLGGVVFGPMDVGESETSPLDPISLANHIEDAFDLVGGMIEIEESTCARVEISFLHYERCHRMCHISTRSLLRGVMEHPVVDLLMSEIEWLGPFGHYSGVSFHRPCQSGSPKRPRFRWRS